MGKILIAIGCLLAVICLFAPGWFKLMLIFPAYMAIVVATWERRFNAIDSLARSYSEKEVVKQPPASG